PKGQTEAAYAIGLRKTQLMTLILLPQAITSMLPAVVSQLVVIVKDTALGGILVGYVELRRVAGNSASAYGNLLPTYFVVAIIYILINLALGALSTWLERKLRTRRGGGKVVQIDPAAQTDLMAARQEIEILDAPGIDEYRKP
ncbi:MAG TPA: ABC transporter permease subunit, partial [Nakamurella sp.]